MEYQINQQQLRKEKQRMAIYHTCFLLVIFCWVYTRDDTQSNIQNPSIIANIVVNIIVIFVVLLLVAFSYNRLLDNISSKWLKYKLIISNGTITREVYGKPIIYIEEKDITGVYKTVNGDLNIYTSDKGLSIPPIIENMEEIVAYFEMNEIIITKTNTTFYQKNSKKIIAAYAFLLTTNFFITNKIVVAVIGALVIGAPVWFLISFIKDNRPRQDKVKVMLFVLFIIFLAGMNIYSRLFK